MKLRTTNHYHGQESLECPACGEDYTHIVGVEAFVRGEDAEHGIHVLVNQARAVIDNDISRNTSERRDSVHLILSCELCGLVSRIEFNQHKGITNISIGIEGQHDN